MDRDVDHQDRPAAGVITLATRAAGTRTTSAPRAGSGRAALTGHRVRVAVMLAGLVVLAVYLLPGLQAPGAHWPLCPLPWSGHPPNPARILASDLYVLCGLGVLAGTALALIWEAADPPDPDRAGPGRGELA
jgi:hypothetical protein